MTPSERLVALQNREIADARLAGERFFLGLPDAWYEPEPTYGCENGHVTHVYIKSELRGNLCCRCMKNIVLLPGDYTDTSLTEAMEEIEHGGAA